MPAISPQKGPQEQFLASGADIAIYGGAAGGGKTYALLMEPFYHAGNKGFGAVIFRRTANQITAEGGLWDTAQELYMGKAEPRITPVHSFTFPSGARVSFSSLQYDKDAYSWQGAQIPLLCFDELTHFTKKQFFYLMGRNRSTCGVKPYIRATCNPDADSWVAGFISWWWDPATGYAMPERSGAMRYFCRASDEIVWAGSRAELMQKYGLKEYEIKSATFIASSVYDNKALMDANPEYLSNLKALGQVERERLLLGNWKIKPSAGLYFKRSQAEVVPDVPKSQVRSWVRRWDLAATEPSEGNPSPDATASVLMGQLADRRTIIADVQRATASASEVRNLIKSAAASDKAAYGRVKTIIPQDPGQAGKDQAQSIVKMLAGYPAASVRESGDKVTRAEPFAAQWQAGNVLVVAAPWNGLFFAELEAFPEGAHDDQVDAAAGAFAALSRRPAMNISQNALR
ncbi:MAG: phage terminase large subunit [Acidaminococcales bacterium]|jgi:predicted phage terminase large subunit-like protein|nr:phage terminase large subunit [Acidaminococcales bacterium]